MDFNVRKLLAQAKSAPRTLKIIVAVAAVDLVVLLLAAFTLEDQVDARVAQIEQARADLAALHTKVETTRKEIGRLPELRQKYDAAMSDGVLADQDRQKLIERAQQVGERHRVSDLHYKLNPQQSAPGATPAFAIVTTPVTLASNSLIDSDTLEFWDEILLNLQSHYQIDKMSIERTDADMTTVLANLRSGRPANMVKSQLEFRWVSMRKVAAAGGPGPAKAASASPAASPMKAAEADTPGDRAR
jgi:hypothetical protein